MGWNNPHGQIITTSRAAKARMISFFRGKIKKSPLNTRGYEPKTGWCSSSRFQKQTQAKWRIGRRIQLANETWVNCRFTPYDTNFNYTTGKLKNTYERSQ